MKTLIKPARTTRPIPKRSAHILKPRVAFDPLAPTLPQHPAAYSEARSNPSNAISNTPRYNVLVVEDEGAVARLIEANLQKMKIEPRVVSNGADAIFQFSQREAHLIILDLMLPDKSGFEVCARIRERSNVPIIMLTARDGAEDQLHGLKVGADDYVTKPFDPKLLMARVAAQLRRVYRYDVVNNTPDNSGGVPHGWTQCQSCNYMGPKEKFEEMNEQFRVVMTCPNCNARQKEL
jgi:CheY-like chemotaxis protein